MIDPEALEAMRESNARAQYHMRTGRFPEEARIKVIPLRAFLLVEPLDQPKKSTILTVIAKDEQPQRGDIVRVGEKVKDLAPGDRVLFNRATAIKTGVGDSLLVPEDSVYLTMDTP